MSQKLSGESFLAVLSKSGLIEPQRLHQLVDAYTSAGGNADDPTQVAEALVERHAITRWQADKLLQGKHKGYFLGKYRLLSLLGRGGMSSVYLAEHVLMRRNCAIKVLPAKRVGDSSYLARFHREAQAVASLDHPNIVRAYDVDHQADRDAEIHFLVMEYVEGLSLQELVAKQGPCSYSDAVDYVRQAALGLSHAHKAGLVHRDIKPGNLLLDKRGTVKILDLGLARFFAGDGDQEALTIQHDEKVLGTADYLAPEQALDSHSVDARADIYALGCTLYFLLTGHAPFTEGTLAQRLMAHQTKEPPAVEIDRPDMPASLTALLKKMMAKRPDDRCSTAEETSEALLGWLSQNADPQWKAAHPDLLQGRGSDSTKRVAARVVAPLARPASFVVPAIPEKIAEPTPPATTPAPSTGSSTAVLTPGTTASEPQAVVPTAGEAASAGPPAVSAEPELTAFFAGLAATATPVAQGSSKLGSSSIHQGTGSSKLKLEKSGSRSGSKPASAAVAATAESPAPSETVESVEPEVQVPEVSQSPAASAPAEVTQPSPASSTAVVPNPPAGPDFSFLSGEVTPADGVPDVTAVEAPPAIVINVAPKPVAKPAKAVAKPAAKVVAKAVPVVAKPVVAPTVMPPVEPPVVSLETPQVAVELDSPPVLLSESSAPAEPMVEPELDDTHSPKVESGPPAASPWDFLAAPEPVVAIDLSSEETVAADTANEPVDVEPMIDDSTSEVAGGEEIAAPVEPGLSFETGFPVQSDFPMAGVSSTRIQQKSRSRAATKSPAKPASGKVPASRQKLIMAGAIGGGLLVVVIGLYMFFGGQGGKPQGAATSQPETQPADTVAEATEGTSTEANRKTTKTATAKPSPSASWAQKREATVGPGGEFATISAALAEIERNFDAGNRSDRFLVKIAAGTYTDRIQFSGKGWSQRDWGANVILRGEGTVVLAPSGADPVVRLNNVEGVQLLNVTIKADGKPVAIELAESLDRCLLQNVQVEGFSEAGVLLNGALGPSFSSDRVTLEGLQFRGAATAVAIRAKKGSQSDSVDCQNIVFRKCRFLGPLAAGLSVTGSESRALEIRECLFAETTHGIELLDAAAWTDFLLVNNTFFKNDVAVRVARQPATTSKGLSLRRNLFFESRTADVLIADGFNELTLIQSQMLGTMFGNWSTRPAEEKPSPGHLVIWGGGQQGQTGITFASTTATDPKFLAPAESAPQKNVGGQAAGEPAWIGAVGP